MLSLYSKPAYELYALFDFSNIWSLDKLCLSSWSALKYLNHVLSSMNCTRFWICIWISIFTYLISRLILFTVVHNFNASPREVWFVKFFTIRRLCIYYLLRSKLIECPCFSQRKNAQYDFVYISLSTVYPIHRCLFGLYCIIITVCQEEAILYRGIDKL
jgi:hypothetical protein